MGRALLFLLLFLAACSLVSAPWVTGLSYVLNSLLQPQYIWSWIFYDIPIFPITAGLAIIGLFFSAIQDPSIFQIYRNKQNFMVVVIWVWMHISHWQTSYPDLPASVSPEIVLGTLNSIVIMYFVLLPLCHSEKALKYLCYTFALAGIFYTYWANSAYFNQEWFRFQNNRLVGPDRSPYNDGNVLATLIVMSLPFIFFLFFRLQKPVQKAAIILIVPLAWHALILFGSRASLLGTVATLLTIALIVRSKKINLAIAVAFILFTGYQGALLLERTTETIDKAKEQQEKPVNPRLISWEVGLKLIPKYPLFGAGVQKFEAASQTHFPGMTAHVAHNTFINFSANTGVLTGILFLGLIYLSWKRLWRLRKFGVRFSNVSYYALVSSSTSLLGYFICSMFLDLIIYEPFYIALIINLVAQTNLERDKFQELGEIKNADVSNHLRKTKYYTASMPTKNH
ncbi:polymerase [Marinobacter sp. B9-2]|nr:polymerase [Marinobacter sp. B9-2]